MLSILRNVGLLAFAAIGWAQPQGTGVISGIVTDKASGEPVRKVIVTLDWDGTPHSWATARTGLDGRFAFEGLPPGKFTLLALKDAAGVGPDRLAMVPEIVSLAAGQNRNDIVLQLVRPASISGTVLDADGDPIEAIQVAAYARTFARGTDDVRQVSTARTNDRGEYRMTVGPGAYYVAAGPNFAAFTPAARGTRREVYAREFYGGAGDWKRATRVVANPGDQLRAIDFHLPAARSISVSGQVTGVPTRSDNAPDTVLISLLPPVGSTGNSLASTVAADHSFAFPDVIAGTYQIRATTRVGKRMYLASRTVDLTEDTSGLTVALEPAMDISGRVRIDGAANPAEVTVVMLGQLGDAPMAKIGPDGRFVLENVPAGQRQLRVGAPAGGYVKSARFGKQDAMAGPVMVAPGNEAALDILISMHAGEIVGRIDPGPGKSIRIYLAPPRERRADEAAYTSTVPGSGERLTVTNVYPSTTSDSDGNFRFTGLAPGSYEVFAVADLPPDYAEFDDPRMVQRMARLGEVVEVKEGDVVKCQPRVIMPEQIREAMQ